MNALDVPGDELVASDTALRAFVGQFGEQTLVSLLVARFRSFIALGYHETEALMAAVGCNP